MNIVLKIKKLGNHWYPNIEHEDPIDLVLDRKMEKYFSLLDKNNEGELVFLLSEVHSWLEKNTIQFHDEDIWRWLNTVDTFNLRVYVDDHEFEVCSALLDLFELQFNTNFHKTLYCISLENEI